MYIGIKVFRTIVPVIDQDRTLGASVMLSSRKEKEAKLMLYPFCKEKYAKHFSNRFCKPFLNAIQTDKSINAIVDSIRSKVHDTEAMSAMRYFYDNMTGEVRWEKRSLDEMSRSFDLTCYANKMDPTQIHYYKCKGTTLNLSAMSNF